MVRHLSIQSSQPCQDINNLKLRADRIFRGGTCKTCFRNLFAHIQLDINCLPLWVSPSNLKNICSLSSSSTRVCLDTFEKALQPSVVVKKQIIYWVIACYFNSFLPIREVMKIWRYFCFTTNAINVKPWLIKLCQFHFRSPLSTSPPTLSWLEYHNWHKNLLKV